MARFTLSFPVTPVTLARTLEARLVARPGTALPGAPGLFLLPVAGLNTVALLDRGRIPRCPVTPLEGRYSWPRSRPVPHRPLSPGSLVEKFHLLLGLTFQRAVRPEPF